MLQSEGVKYDYRYLKDASAWQLTFHFKHRQFFFFLFGKMSTFSKWHAVDFQKKKPNAEFYMCVSHRGMRHWIYKSNTILSLIFIEINHTLVPFLFSFFLFNVCACLFSVSISTLFKWLDSHCSFYRFHDIVHWSINPTNVWKSKDWSLIS